ncbi:MAG TPA: hypothetical protein VHW04_23960 [Solirubrobacteraceae bacterium]|nr:hypothetical protein [Solirubrobacteraceae bacterium]
MSVQYPIPDAAHHYPTFTCRSQETALSQAWRQTHESRSDRQQPNTTRVARPTSTDASCSSTTRSPPVIKLIVWLYFQVNPTNVGKRREDVELDNGAALITRVHRSLTIFP